MVSPSKEFEKEQRRKDHADLRTRYALAISAGLLVYRRQSEVEDVVLAKMIYRLAGTMADEDFRCRATDPK